MFGGPIDVPNYTALEARFLTCASDAAFADDPELRTSSQGYVTLLFDGPIAWKASKQRSVVTSSTEAELVSLSHATKEFISTMRLLEQLQLRPSDSEVPFTMLCDNQQTLGLLESPHPQLTSKLKHIDVQRYGFAKSPKTERSASVGSRPLRCPLTV